MRRCLVLLYGVGCYVLFLGVFLYAVGFIGGFLTPTSLSVAEGAAADVADSSGTAQALLVNLVLLLSFAAQHSVMARPGFKRWSSRWVPAPMERSTYVLSTCLVLGLLFWQWQPVGGLVWDIRQPVLRTLLWSLFAGGWLIVLITTFLINHFDLFGLRQVWLYFRGRPCTGLPFVTPGPYRLVRHPLYVGWLLAFWCIPTMSVTHLVFAGLMTVYILVAIVFEERDLLHHHQEYAEYRRRVPRLIPRLLPQAATASRRSAANCR